MEDHIKRLINDLELVARETSDPVKRAEILKTISRLSSSQSWPSEDEIMQIRMICNHNG